MCSEDSALYLSGGSVSHIGLWFLLRRQLVRDRLARRSSSADRALHRHRLGRRLLRRLQLDDPQKRLDGVERDIVGLMDFAVVLHCSTCRL